MANVAATLAGRCEAEYLAGTVEDAAAEDAVVRHISEAIQALGALPQKRVEAIMAWVAMLLIESKRPFSSEKAVKKFMQRSLEAAPNWLGKRKAALQPFFAEASDATEGNR